MRKGLNWLNSCLQLLCRSQKCIMWNCGCVIHGYPSVRSLTIPWFCNRRHFTFCLLLIITGVLLQCRHLSVSFLFVCHFFNASFKCCCWCGFSYYLPVEDFLTVCFIVVALSGLRIHSNKHIFIISYYFYLSYLKLFCLFFISYFLATVRNGKKKL